jgi:transposase
MNFSPLLPDPRQVRLDGMTIGEQAIALRVTTIQPRVQCPHCHHPSTRRHSRYVRTVADLPWLGGTVRLVLYAVITQRVVRAVVPRIWQRVWFWCRSIG